MMKKKYISVLVAAFALFSGLGNALAIPVISVDLDPGTTGIQSTLSVAAGDSFGVDVVIADVVGLNAFEFDLDFDAAVVSATGVVSGGFLTGSTLVVESDFAAPDVNFAELFFGPFNVTGSGILASITFDAGLVAGSSALHLGDVVLSGLAFSFTPVSIPFTLGHGADGGGVCGSAVTSWACVTVTAAAPGPVLVPEPGAFVLMGSGLIGWVLWKGRALVGNA